MSIKTVVLELLEYAYDFSIEEDTLYTTIDNKDYAIWIFDEKDLQELYTILQSHGKRN